MMGTNPAIRVKGLSQKRYNFIWDKEIRHFAYEPENQREIDDIFRTQGKLYRTMFFSAWMDEKLEEVVEEEAPKPKPKAKSPKTKAKAQPVAAKAEGA